jgi:hypothetical protein
MPWIFGMSLEAVGRPFLKSQLIGGWIITTSMRYVHPLPTVEGGSGTNGNISTKSSHN